jgi:hypothetical protein
VKEGVKMGMTIIINMQEEKPRGDFISLRIFNNLSQMRA